MGRRGVRQEELRYVERARVGSGRLVRKEREVAGSRNWMRKEVFNIERALIVVGGSGRTGQVCLKSLT